MVLALAISLLIEAQPPSALKALVTEARIAATSDENNGGISKELLPRAKAIKKYGEQAIPLVMPLLQHPSPGVRNFFGFVVADLPGLTQRDLAPLIAAYRGGNGWVARAIGRIDSQAARDFLVEAFLAKPEHHSGLGFALVGLGERGGAALVRPLRTKVAVQPDFRHEACGVLQEVGEPAAKLVPMLLATLEDEQLPLENRLAALTFIACTPAVSETTTHSVDTIVKASKALSRDAQVGELQTRLGTPDGISRIVDRLAEHPSEVVYLARAGQSARKAEPAALRLLKHEHAEIRLAAIEALGMLGGKAAATRLVEFLPDPRDWRAPCAAARALAQLKALDQKGAIQAAEHSAWFQPTAKCIGAARRLLENGRAPEQDRSLWDIPDGERLVPSPTPGRGTDELDERSREKLRVTGAVRSLTEEGIWATENVTAPPIAALAVDAGILSGTNRGEWGGELVLLPAGAGQRLILEENVVGIHRLGGQIAVVTGLAHLGSRRGMLYRVVAETGGKLLATEWRVLPGAPERSFVLHNGRLFVSCTGADIVIDQTGTISIATQALVE